MEPLTADALAARIDHTNLDPAAGAPEIARLCDEAQRFGFHAVCVNGVHVAHAARRLAGGRTLVCAVVGFPLGASTTAVKLHEARLALAEGAREIDMVCRIDALVHGDDACVRADVAAVAQACAERGAALKVILETGRLDPAAKRRGCVLAAEAGAAFVKTSTGFLGSGATVEDVALLRSATPAALGVKASGGIRTLAEARALLAAGASRLGCSRSVAILEELTAARPERDARPS